ncbi:DUF4865 family protein [Deinococcus cellulosilyticus]|uniref:DUF4865 domain-containing protein n=1 Tax=Deinococcus cellulosilyticus (strain DSM 18568 / NBRC 106333 / KACC 11606 / 5516J-15) TaxID=1223518 RepID=A0A511N8Z9_DEIC1|nr:DUF4865 family protein [Deinococcus cellulosilyticus]GEM49292.1 DUF4865 domain-containing protein [Deinococcus cellulosilyticus NBRC 106333 = KACC 11606]
MHLMHYDIRLPEDFDMTAIRERVRTRGHALDRLPGLGFKAYLMREAGVAGSTVNSYSPFYLWTSGQAMQNFLLGPGFAGLSRDFGRPAVERWMGLQFCAGPASQTPRWATLHRTVLASDADLMQEQQEASKRLESLSRHAHLHGGVLGLDPHRWERVEFLLWAGKPEAVQAARFEVLHLSRPEWGLLNAGR